MVPDVMHDVLEGVAPYEVKEMIKFYTSNGFFTLTELNNRIESLSYPLSDSSSKPSIIPLSTLSSNDHKVNQHGNTLKLMNCTCIYQMFFMHKDQLFTCITRNSNLYFSIS